MYVVAVSDILLVLIAPFVGSSAAGMSPDSRPDRRYLRAPFPIGSTLAMHPRLWGARTLQSVGSENASQPAVSRSNDVTMLCWVHELSVGCVQAALECAFARLVVAAPTRGVGLALGICALSSAGSDWISRAVFLNALAAPMIAC